MPFPSPIRPPRQVRVVLSSTALLSFMSVRKAVALAVAQLGVSAFFLAGPARSALGESAVWFVLAAAVLSAFVRALDVESWALFVPGGFVGRIQHAFGPRAARVAAAAGLTERLFLAALACLVIGHYAAAVVVTAIAGLRLTGHVRPEDVATLLAVLSIGLLWIRARIGRNLSSDALAKGVWVGVGILLLTIGWGFFSIAGHGGAFSGMLASPPSPIVATGWPLLDVALVYLFGLALALPAVGSGEALARAAHELPPPRVQALRRTGLLTVLFTLFATSLGTFLFVLLVPPAELSLWTNAPLAGLAQHLRGPSWTRDLIALALAAGAWLMLLPAAHAALTDAEQMLQELSIEGLLPEGLTSLHTRFGTPARAVDVAVGGSDRCAAGEQWATRMAWASVRDRHCRDGVAQNRGGHSVPADATWRHAIQGAVQSARGRS